MDDTPKNCDICSGTGEVSYFKGASRFVLSQEICPACNGSGWVVDGDETFLGKDSDVDQGSSDGDLH